MSEYVCIDISEGIDINKTNALRECDIFHYWYFKDVAYKNELHLCNGSHDLMQEAMNFNDVALYLLKQMITQFTFGI